MRHAIALALALLATGTTGASGAEEAGWYGGIDTSRGRTGLAAAEFGLGYRFSPSFRIEGHYVGREPGPGFSGISPGLRIGEPGSGIVIGAGATYEFTRRLYGRLSWSRDPSRPGDFNFYSLGVGVRF